MRLLATVSLACFCLGACGTTETPSTTGIEEGPDVAGETEPDVPIDDLGADSESHAPDGGPDTPADSLVDPLDDTAEDAGADCLTNEEFFELRIWNEFAGTVCASCHRPGGLADDSRLMLIPESTEEALATNYETFAALANDPVGSTLLLLKPINRHSEHHTGGEAIDADSQAYADLVEFVLRVTGEVEECDPTLPVVDDCLDPWPGERLTRRLTREEYRRSVGALL
jgi:mono/diheme cytochrome c family protein